MIHQNVQIPVSANGLTGEIVGMAGGKSQPLHSGDFRDTI